ncbi:unnamed protein product [Aphanomyces euteiches]|uniref:Rab-GAP TBC domain-containing protein n=1 Tax=Aphanomyces euteiches TaxID=100861 RepID=A0A6G0XAF6_9STRA|nr:hypothetical protein Ae201684_006916 [Aphanomyces euteiches]KAH9086846.1 hypothetical protein Ae201684P_000264 [Aphanomyces euteiches]KAH9132108.1 hypothetical protein AeRB84_021375 [Aphanomyces euteiches]
MLNIRQLKHKTLTRIGVAQSFSDPTFEATVASFRRLEEALPQLYQHVLTSIASCHSFCHTLTTTFSHIQGDDVDDKAFLQTMQRILEQADGLEQAMSLTVVAPIQGLMQQCANMHGNFLERDKFVINYDLLKLEFSSAAPTDPLRAIKLEKMERAWHEYQDFVHNLVEEVVKLEEQFKAARREVMQAMQLHVAKFFQACQRRLWSSLDMSPPPESFAEWDIQQEGEKTTSPSNRVLAKQYSTHQDVANRSFRLQANTKELAEATTVASTPMAALPVSPKRGASSPSRQSWLLDLFWGKEDSGSEGKPPPPPSPRRSVASRKNKMSLAPQEWAAVEAVLWELDEQASPTKVAFPVAASISPRLALLTMTDLVSIYSYLDVVSLSRLAQTCKGLQAQLLGSTALWHHVIRLGGVPATIRCSFWVWFQYKRVDTEFDGKDQYDSLLVQAAQLVRLQAAEDENTSTSQEEDEVERQQILAWFNDIDVDVGRTCHKSLFTKDVAEEWDLVQIPENDVAALVEQALLVPSPQHAKEQTKEERLELQATMRRLLRAYVMLNPRIGYCQGMNFIVRLLLDNQADEAAVFWTFVSLCDASQSLFEPGFHALHGLFTKLEVLIQQQMPEVHSHLQHHGVHVSMFAARWFLTLFTSLETFGPTLVVRLLDLFHVDRHRILCGIALVVLEELKELVLDSDFETILAILQYPRAYMPEPDFDKRKELMQHALVVSITRSLLIS